MAAGSDFLQLDATGVPRGGLAGWLTDALRAAVADGSLGVGATLPASRTLAADLGLSRGVVVEAYRRLADEGLFVTGGARGTVVATAPRPAPADAGTERRAQAPLDLSPGLPDLSAFPRAAWLRAEREVLDGTTAADLGYPDPRGHPLLRREISAWLRRTRGVVAAPDEIVVVAGVAQALAVLSRVLVRADTPAVGVEDPGSKGAREQMAHWGMAPVAVPVDDSGLDVEALRRAGVPTVLLTPAHQFPTGVVLAPARRRALLDWAADGGLVVEDDYDAEFRYDRPPVPALQCLAPELVAHAGSVSKTLAPGLRLGWLVVPARLRDEVVHERWMADLGAPALPQLVFAHLLASGALERHLRRVRVRVRARRDAMLDALREHLPEVTVHGIAAGLHLMVTFANQVDDRALADAAAADGVLVQPLSDHRIAPGPPGLVIGYAAQSPDRIRRAVALLARSARALAPGVNVR
ncbi:PLP-dependent aminotransferase family protein [Pseudonocardia sp. N23]|uniref:MocR-like pyridoxine biosynthesis transcription factor PdxR n=1 Tax=Pseudonocardia sp. N23 TaxID=1987376 RepID=UPI000BFB906C|nr:PLP-dependent aminotransferase family protein [Pseudonocardia sp. N23]